MAIFRNLRVRLRFESSKYFNVFLRLKSSPFLTLQKISHSRTASWAKDRILWVNYSGLTESGVRLISTQWTV